MLELVVAIGVVVIIILGWSYMKRALDFTGNQIGQTANMFEDLTKSGSIQTSRGVVISQEGLDDTIESAREKATKRAQNRTKFESKLSADEKKHLTDWDKKTADLLLRK